MELIGYNYIFQFIKLLEFYPSCKPHYMTDDQDHLYSHIPNCTNMEKVAALNKALDLQQTFSDFKQYHKRPCTNFAMTYEKKIKV